MKKTKAFMGKPVPVVITVYKDKNLIYSSPPASFFIREAAKLKSGSRNWKSNCRFNYNEAAEDCKEKMKDLNAFD